MQLKSYNISGFNLASFFCRGEGLHGGTAIYCKQGLTWRARNDLVVLSEEGLFECAAIEVQLQKTKAIVISVYRTPTAFIEEFLVKMEDLLIKIFDESTVIFIAGDFNIDIKGNDKCTLKFLSLLSSFNIFPAVRDYTRISRTSKSCIDNIYTNCKSFTAEIIDSHISDHTAQKLAFEIDDYSNHKTSFTRRLFSKENKETFKQILSEQDWLNVFSQNEMDVNKQWENFMQTLLPIFNQCFPLKHKKHKDPKKNDYQKTPELLECKKQLDLLLVLSRIEDGYKETYNTVKRRYNQLLIDSRKQRYKHQILESDNKSKSVWKIVNTIKGDGNKTGNGNHIPGDPKTVSNNFNNHVINAAPKMLENFPKIKFSTSISSNENSIFINPVTTEEVIDIINSLKNKMSAGHDEIPSSIVKFCGFELSIPLCYIINNSFKYGIFPEQLKLALVKPIYKKGDPEVLDNYRPISLLPSFSKIFEIAMANRLLNFFRIHKLFEDCQHGYLEGRSVETAVYDFVEKIIQNLEQKNIAMGVFLDLSKAFDSLDHAIILEKLELYGIRGIALQWIRSYLTDRYQKVVNEKDHKKYFSERGLISFGIPQGSILGPLLFIIYINDVVHALSDETASLINYADDTNLLIGAETFPDLITKTDISLNNMNDWFLVNRLILNKSKTNYICFRTKQSKIDIPKSATLLTQNVTLSQDTKFLGIHIDQNLSWEKEIQYVCNKLNSVSYTLRIMTKYLEFDVLKIIYCANFQSILRFGIIFWGGSKDFHKIFIIQKRTIRLLLGLKARESCRGKFRELGILTVTGLYIYGCLLFLFRNKRKFTKYEIVHNYNTRSLCYNIPEHRLTLSERNPAYSCIKFYNKLPTNIKELTTLRDFKKQVFNIILAVEPYNELEFLTAM